MIFSSFRLYLVALTLNLLLSAPAALAQSEPAEPVFGQPGKDVVWVPTQPATLDKMLDMARVTAQDYVMDLGSGDGRNIIAAAKRGARALGVEWDANLVEVSKRAAAEAGVADKASFVTGDMFEADISQATVLALYLLPELMRKLIPRFMTMKPGSRIVSNTFPIEGWRPDETDKGPGACTSWCTVLLYLVPADFAGTWRLAQGELTISQNAQAVTGTMVTGGTSNPITNGNVRGEQITFSAGGITYSGRIAGDAIKGETSGGATVTWDATRIRK